MLAKNKLPVDFYQGTDVKEIAIGLLGKYLYTNVDGKITGGMIVETEAYDGVMDKACHAYGGRFTERTKIMYGEGGTSYVYLCYGIHYLFNIVTGPENTPQVVLIRGIEPLLGLETMLHRRNMNTFKPSISAGPGALAKALGITKVFNGKDLCGDDIWIVDNGIKLDPQQVVSTKRIGVAYAQEDALLLWRFYIKENKFVSRQ